MNFEIIPPSLFRKCESLKYSRTRGSFPLSEKPTIGLLPEIFFFFLDDGDNNFLRNDVTY
jgi:hypothetical protein